MPGRKDPSTNKSGRAECWRTPTRPETLKHREDSTVATVFKRGGKGKYYFQYYDHNGKRQTKCARTTDKAKAQRIANKYEGDAALRRDGVIDPSLEAIQQQAHRTIESHLADFKAKLRSAKSSDRHVRDTCREIRTLATFAKWKTAADIKADGATRYASHLRDLGRSSRTIEKALGAMKQFTKWLVEGEKLPRDPLAGVKKPNPAADRKRERRELLADEWPHLDAATRKAPTRYKMTGPERALLYRTAIETGLRAAELRSLTRGNLHLDGERPYITCKPRSTKNRKPAKQYIQTALAAELRAHIATKAPTAPVFRMVSESKIPDMIRADLADARKAWLKEARKNPHEFAQRQESDFLLDVNHEGQVLDFHALRHTCGAWLARAGVYPNIVRTVMRHSTLKLTYDTYGHLFPGEEADAVTLLADVFGREPESLQATGTDGQGAQHYAQQLGCESREIVRFGATQCDESFDDGQETKRPKSATNEDLGDACDSVRENAKRRRPDSNRRWRICNPLP